MHTTHTNQPVVYRKARYSTALSSFRIDSTLVTSFLSIRILSLNILFSPTIFMCIPFFRKARRMKKETIDFHFQWPFIHIHWLRCWEHHLPPSTKSFHSLYKRLWFHCLPTPLSLYIFSSILTLDTRINDTHTHHAILLQNHHFYVANFLCIKYRWFFFFATLLHFFVMFHWEHFGSASCNKKITCIPRTLNSRQESKRFLFTNIVCWLNFFRRIST